MPPPINMPPLPSKEQLDALPRERRVELYEAWRECFVHCNPAYFHSDGSQRSIWNYFFGRRR